MEVLRWLAAIVLIVMPAAACLALSACSPATKHKVLSFFLDGVPPLEAPTSGAGPPGAPGDEAVAAGPAPAPVRFFPHPPYRDNRCDGCHDMNRGELVLPLAQGLCRSCHEPLVAKLRYVHGPVAVDACTECHHYHSSPFPALLLADPVVTCVKCHDAEDLSAGAYHAGIQGRDCTECHNPHGGDDRFFLQRSTP